MLPFDAFVKVLTFFCRDWLLLMAVVAPDSTLMVRIMSVGRVVVALRRWGL